MLKINDKVVYQGLVSSVVIPHTIVAVGDNGKVVLRGNPGTIAVTVKIAHIGNGRDPTKKYCVEN